MDINTTSLALGSLPDWVTAIATAVLVAATIINVIFAGKLTKETVKLREVETSPFISIIFDTSFQATSHSKIVIKNIGKAPAYNITFEVEEKYLPYFNGYTFENKIPYFAPDQEFYILASGFNSLKEAGFDNIPIIVNYQAKDKRGFSELFGLKWQHFQYYIKDNLQEINESFSSLNRELKELNQTIKTKRYFVSSKLSVLGIEKKDDYVQIIFSNNEVHRIERVSVGNIGLSNIDKVNIYDGDVVDLSTNIKLTAEEVLYNIHNFLEVSKDNK